MVMATMGSPFVFSRPLETENVPRRFWSSPAVTRIKFNGGWQFQWDPFFGGVDLPIIILVIIIVIDYYYINYFSNYHLLYLLIIILVIDLGIGKSTNNYFFWGVDLPMIILVIDLGSK